MKYIKLFESFESIDIDVKLKSINDFGKYLSGINNESLQSFIGYYKSNVNRIHGIDPFKKPSIPFVPDDQILNVNKDFEPHVNRGKNIEYIEDLIDKLYIFSQSKRHDLSLINHIKDIFIPLDHNYGFKMKSINPVYDGNVIFEDGTLIPKFLVFFSIKNDKYRGPVTKEIWEDIDPMLQGFGLKCDKVNFNGGKIVLSQL